MKTMYTKYTHAFQTTILIIMVFTPISIVLKFKRIWSIK